MVAFLGGAARVLRAAGLRRPVRAARNAIDAVLLRLDRPLLRAQVSGVELRGFLRHRSFLADLRHDYEPTLRELIVSSVNDRSLFVDVGAHIGLYSLLAHEAGATVIAVEPDPYNRAALRANLAGRDVKVIASAMSDAIGTATFHTSASTIGSSLVDRPGIEMGASIACRQRPSMRSCARR